MRNAEEGKQLKHRIIIVFVGSLIALVLSILLLLLMALGVLGGMISEDGAYSAVPVICGIAALAASLFAVKKSGTKALLTGLSTGALFFVLLLLGRIIGWREATGNVLTSFIACGAGGALAGLWGARSKKKRKF